MILVGKLPNHRLRFPGIKQTPPFRHNRQNAHLIYGSAATVDGEGITLRIRKPEKTIQLLLFFIELLFEGL